MLNEKPLSVLEDLVNIIYSPDQEGLDNAFVDILDAFTELVEGMAVKGYTVDMTEELMLLQSAYMKKDYVELADVLLYDIKPSIQEISL